MGAGLFGFGEMCEFSLFFSVRSDLHESWKFCNFVGTIMGVYDFSLSEADIFTYKHK